MGSTLASFCVEAFSLDRLLRLTRPEIDARYRLFKELTALRGALTLDSSGCSELRGWRRGSMRRELGRRGRRSRSTRASCKIKEQHGLETLGIAFYDSETTLQWSYNADAWFHAASTMKLAVLLGVYRQVDARRADRWTRPCTCATSSTSIVDGRLVHAGREPRRRPRAVRAPGPHHDRQQLAYQMITTSSNFATNLLVDVVGVAIDPGRAARAGHRGRDGAARGGGPGRLRGRPQQRGHRQRAAEAAAPHRRRARPTRRRPRARCWRSCSTSAARAASRPACPQAARVAHKTGNISTVHHDAGIVYLEDRKPYVLVILTQFDAGPAAEHARSPRSRATSTSAWPGIADAVQRRLMEQGAGPQGRRRLRPRRRRARRSCARTRWWRTSRGASTACRATSTRSPRHEAARDIRLTAHFGLNEFLLVDLKEAQRLRSIPRYVPCAVRILAFYLERLREAVGAPSTSR